MATITNDSITLSQNWGAIQFNDYYFDGLKVDFQDLMVAVAEKRAVTVEGEVTPMSVRMRARNATLDKLGTILAELTKAQAGFEGDDKGTRDMRGDWLSNATGDYLKNVLGYSCHHYTKTDDRPGENDRADFYEVGDRSSDKYSANKKTVEAMIQSVKSKIDSLNNAAQTDMSRLQSLVDRRDESYSTATNLMTNISDTRSNLIRNL